MSDNKSKSFEEFLSDSKNIAENYSQTQEEFPVPRKPETIPLGEHMSKLKVKQAECNLTLSSRKFLEI